MAKTKTTFFCQNCGAQFPKWVGKCNSCNEWNTIVEEIIQKEDKGSWKSSATTKKVTKAVKLKEITAVHEERINTCNNELNRVLGGGLVKGSVVLLGGEPGLILTETKTHQIFNSAEETVPEVIVIDSIQTLHTEFIEASPGSISQIRETTAELIKYAKETDTPVVLIGHITKEGNIAGPKILEHMVDVVLQFEGDRNHTYRILRAQKNRFGSTAELGIYEMRHTGLREVENPSEILISEKDADLTGTAISATLEGMRPLMIEVQALVSTAVYGTPQRSCTGYNLKRLNMLLAVLEKRAGFKLGAKDVFLNIAGGLRVEDPAIDLAVVCAVLSSNNEISIPQNICFAAEVGLAGEIRAISRVEQRIQEAEKLGFKKIILSKFNKISKKNSEIEILRASKIEEVVGMLFRD